MRILLVLVIAAALAGCGRAGDRDEVRAVVTGFLADVRAGDGAAACARLSGPTREALASQEGKPCARAVTDLDLGRGPVAGTEVVVESARVQLRDGVDVFLDRGSSGWHISAAGCRPVNGPKRPMDCQLES